MNRKIALLGLAVIAAFALSLMAGNVWIGPDTWFAGRARAPRSCWNCGCRARCSGWRLARCSVCRARCWQGYLRNPLADPAVVGVSSSAALGAVAAIVAGIASSPLVLFACAMAGAGGAMALLAALTWRQASGVQFILAGTVLASLAGALTAFIISVAPNPYAVAEVLDWLMGALTDRGMDDVALALPFIAAGMVALALTGSSLDALALGEDTARSLGVSLGACKRWSCSAPGSASARAWRRPAWSASSG